tara:strand:+ start:4680 stop:5822 length:1143 start_codon:yes stop_codon:yes gene_type:complete
MEMSTAKDMTAPEVFNSKRLNEIRKTMLSGKEVDSCHSCYRNEERGFKSRRQRKIVAELGKTELTNTIAIQHKPRLKHIELNFSNTCNLACAMCNRTHSSGWMQQDKLMPPSLENKISSIYKAIGTPRENFKPYALSDKFVQSIVDNILEYKSILIKGGEPLYDKRCIAFLHKVADLHPTVKTVIVSNITTLTPRMIDTLSKLKNLELNFSIDGIGSIYNWIRGFDWNEVDKNFKTLMQLGNVSIDVNVTVSLWNIHLLADMIKHFSQFRPASKRYFMSFHVVYEPWMHCSLSDDELKNHFLNDIKPEMEQWTFDKHRHMGFHQSDIDNLERHIQSSDLRYGTRQEMTTLAKEWITWLNSVRNMKLEDEAPHIRRLLING